MAEALQAQDFGAIGDGCTLNTAAIQAAIDAAAVAGGRLVFAPGVYRTGSLFLKSGMALQLDAGVTLLGSQDLADYPLMPTRIAGIEMVWPAALVNVCAQQNVEICGEGCIDGDGQVFWDSYWALRRRYEPLGLRWASDYDAQRPRLVQVYESFEVHIGDGLLLRRAGFWGLHLCYSERVRVEGITIRNNGDEGQRGPSTDGIDIDSCRDVLVQQADIAVNDDALVLKAGRDADGLRVAACCDHIVIRDCIVREGAAGITFGSECSGGFRDIEVSGIEVHAPVPVGILFKSAPTRGGFAQQLKLSNIRLIDVPVVMRATMNWNPGYSRAEIPAGMAEVPAHWRVIAAPVSAEEGRTRIADVQINGLLARGARVAFEVEGVDAAPLTGFRFEGVDIEAAAGGHIYGARDWQFTATRLTLGEPLALPNERDVQGLPGKTWHLQATLSKPDPSLQSFEVQDVS
ncbi:glycoside hydrolase family 28 protein [Pelomonas sp. V22]|uniref:glycoside hydrolase family 28 protein n=1 Tax=Pelomonas sp. V22 TaxID=2822139 RepID=UPI0024A9567E|nr:glycosyl hydrolase family 28 protein [Pelomonas sp. V22]MDI4635443.1 glycoside hydrolase family 28 protein [Pelomonas sp. V22]